jgi:hypothetical protein
MSSHTPSVDFLIIGAQKAGTTSLFEYIRRHPQIHMPAEKEISFFSRDYDRGWDWYAAIVLRNAPRGAVCGEASIGYMGGTPYADITRNEQGYRPRELDDHLEDGRLEAVIPERIRETIPEVKLICVLRDPVARAYSHYQMATLEGTESRTFDDAIDSLLARDALINARVVPTNTNGYIVNGEYHRVLGAFLDIFPREQLLPILSSELSTDTASTLARVFDFVGASTDFVPDNLNARYRTAATRRRIPGFDLYDWQLAVAKLRPLRALWHSLPVSLRLKIDQGYRVAGYRVTVWNALRGKTTQDMPVQARARLIEHFRPDSQALSRLLDLEIPWLEDWQTS